MRRNWHGIVVLLLLVCSIASPAGRRISSGQKEQNAAPEQVEMEQAMEKMHAGMAGIKPSGDDDVDFVRLMLPHHQAAIDMAKVELTHGKDPQVRRLAQEIVIDQQSEIDLMQLWLKQHGPDSRK